MEKEKRKRGDVTVHGDATHAAELLAISTDAADEIITQISDWSPPYLGLELSDVLQYPSGWAWNGLPRSVRASGIPLDLSFKDAHITFPARSGYKVWANMSDPF